MRRLFATIASLLIATVAWADCPLYCDENDDGRTDTTDYIEMQAQWGNGSTCNPPQGGPTSSDCNGDGCVNTADFVILSAEWFVPPVYVPLDDSWSHEGAVVERTSQSGEVYAGSYALKMVTPADQYKRASILNVQDLIDDKPIVSELYFKFPSGERDSAIEVAMEGWDKVNQINSSIHYVDDIDYEITGWRYWDGDPTWTFVPDGDVQESSGTWHYFRFIADYSTEKYVEIKVDDTTYSMDLDIEDIFSYPSEHTWFQQSVLTWTQDSEDVAKTFFIDNLKFGYMDSGSPVWVYEQGFEGTEECN